METLHVGQKLTAKQVGKTTLGYMCYMFVRPQGKLGTAEELDMMENYRIASNYISKLDKEGWNLAKAYYDSYKMLQTYYIDTRGILNGCSDAMRIMSETLTDIFHSELIEHNFYGQPKGKFKFMKDNTLYSASRFLNEGGEFLTQIVSNMDRARHQIEEAVFNYNCFEMLVKVIGTKTGCSEVKYMSIKQTYDMVIKNVYGYYKRLYKCTLQILDNRGKEGTLDLVETTKAIQFIVDVFKPIDFKKLTVPEERKTAVLEYLNEDITRLSYPQDKIIGIIYRGDNID